MKRAELGFFIICPSILCVSVYTFDENFQVTEKVQNDYEENGYILLRGVFSKEEISHILKTIEGSNALTQHIHKDAENEDKLTEKIMWRHPGSDVTGMVARSQKVAGISEKLIGGELYHYHTKLMMKNAGKGSKHVWHQDYGYWYNNGCLFPDMMTVFIPLDPCRRDNSCLQILHGSHKCGRIDHVIVGAKQQQVGCDVDRVEAIKKTCPHLYVEMDPGDALYFHCNLVHCSSDNESDRRRWAFLTAYNKATNNPTIEHYNPRYTPLLKVPDSSIMGCTNFTDMSGKEFIDPEKFPSYRGNIQMTGRKAMEQFLIRVLWDAQILQICQEKSL